MTSPRNLLHFVAALMLCGTTSSASAQTGEWPKSRPIQWLIGFAAGGAADTITRAIADRVSKSIGQAVVIENRTGAAGAIALSAVATAKPDGYMLITMPGPILYARPVPEVGGELDAIALLGKGPMVLAGPASPEMPDLKAFVARAKADPAKFNFGSSGTGSSQHIAGALLNEKAGIKMAHVPYRGGAQVINDVLSGTLQLAVLGAGPLAPHIEAGKIRGYAVTTAKRFPTLPEVPTMTEAGIDGFDLGQWFGVATAKGTPVPIVQRLHAEIRKATATPEIRDLMLKQGIAPAAGPPDEFTKVFVADKAVFSALAERFSIKIE